MPIKIPIVDQSVDINIPKPINPADYARNPVAGAFGEFQSKSRLGDTVADTGSMLAKYAEKKRKNNEDLVYSQESGKLSLSLHDLKYSTDDVESTDANGNIVTNKKGFYNRLGKDSIGSTSYIAKEGYGLVNEQASRISDPNAKSRFIIDSHAKILALQDSAAAHELTQTHKYYEDSHKSTMKIAIDGANTATTPDETVKFMKDARNAQLALDRLNGVSEEESAIGVKEVVGKVVSNSVFATLQSTGDINKAKDILTQSKDYIDGKTYKKINTGLGVEMERITKQQVKANFQSTVNNEVKTMTSLLKGELSWATMQDISKMAGLVGGPTEKFVQSIQNVVDSQGDYIPVEQDNVAFSKWIDAAHSGKDVEELQKVWTNLLQDNPKMSVDRMSVLINAIVQRSGVLPLSLKSGDASKMSNEQKALDSGAMAIANYGRRNKLENSEIESMYRSYMKQVSENVLPQVAYASTLKYFIVEKYPQAATMENPPNMVLDENSPIRFIFPRGKNAGTSNKNVSK